MAETHEIVLVNEFVEVRVRAIESRNGRALEIHSGRTGHTTVLDPFALDVLASISPQELVNLVQRQYDGPPTNAADVQGLP